MNKDRISQLLIEKNVDYRIASFRFQLIEDLCSVLMPFKFGSEQMSSDQQPTLHLVLPFLKRFRVSGKSIHIEKEISFHSSVRMFVHRTKKILSKSLV